MRTRFASLALVALAGPVLVAAALAAESGAVSPAEGTVGTTVSVTAADAGTVKPKVSIRAVGTRKKRPLRVTEFTTNSVSATVLSGKAGTYDVVLDTKNGTDEEFAACFTIRTPDAESVMPAAANPQQTVTIVGAYFGTKKPSVKIGRKVAKVTTFTDAGIGFTVPTTLANGTYDVVVKNKVGTDTLVGALTIRNSTVGLVPIKGAAKFTATVNSTAYAGGGPDIPANEAVSCSFREGLGTIVFSSRASRTSGEITTQQDLAFEVNADLNDGVFPKTLTATTATYSRSEIGTTMPTAGNYDLVQSGGMVNVTISRYVGGRIEASFSGTINKTGGAPAAPATAVIADGAITADVVVDAGGVPLSR
jgi:hypothetical protein